jgi:AcrR family transcriptional regulator
MSQPAGRAEIIAAAMEVIAEQGYYRASSNAIARRAGLTWGTIQYHFGSREALMLAALEDSVDRLVRQFTDAELEGDDDTTRIRSLIARWTDFCCTPSYMAIVQIMWNLASDERTREETRNRLIHSGKRVDVAFQGLAATVGAPGFDDDVVEIVRKLSFGLGINLANQWIARDFAPAERDRQRLQSQQQLADMVVAFMRTAARPDD